jgi:hypothetical protein
MLESMIQAPEPTPAEVADVANAVIDGSSAVMLSAETSVGAYPVEAVLAMAQIAEAAEEAPEIHGRAREIAPHTTAGGVMHAAVELAEELDATALIVPTSTGGAPRARAKYRRRRPIVALAQRAGGRSADAGVGRLPDDDVGGRVRRRADGRARLRRAVERGARRADGRPAGRHAGSDRPDHGPRDAVKLDELSRPAEAAVRIF